jgi:hypothetical protein
MTPALRTLLALSLCDNYSRWIASRCLPHLGERNIEVGCGIGNVLQYLPNTVGVDLDGRSCDLVHALTEKLAVKFTLAEFSAAADTRPVEAGRVRMYSGSRAPVALRLA